MKYNKCIVAIIFVLIYAESGYTQKKFDVHLSFDSVYNTSEIEVIYDNGIERYERAALIFDNYHTKVSSNFISYYASLQIRYKNFSKFFFIKEGTTKLHFSKPINQHNFLENYSSKRAIDLAKIGESELNSFISPEIREYQLVYEVISKNGMSDSLFKVARSLGDSILMKKTEWVINNQKENYFPFWLFRREISYNDLLPRDSLFQIFNSFPSRFTESDEGEIAKQIITGLQLKKGEKAPYFEGKDIDSKEVRLNDFKGKHLLLVFWASWCKPCIKEMPKIVELEELYGDQLDFLFINRDSDSIKFIKAVNKYNIDFGIHMDVTDNIMKSYGAQALPQVYLIDPNGFLVYSRKEENDGHLEKLLELISMKLN